MSRKKTSNGGGGKFKRLLGWTVLMAIVFSAGLITGERLVRKQALAPLVSVTDQVAEPAKSDGAVADEKDDDEADEEPTFAFFDQLTRKDDVALSSKRKSQKKGDQKADKPAPKKAKPAKKPEPQPEQAPEPAKKPAAAKEAAKDAQAEKTEPPARTEKPAAKKSGADQVAARYTLQVAAHPDMDSAKAHMERLRKMGLEPHLISAAIPGKGKFYRVRVGKFGSMDEARSFQSDLKRKNSLSTFVSPL